MSTLAERIRGLFRYRVGKYDSNTVAQNVGLFPMTKSGASINENSALAISTVYACVYKIASTIAALGLEIYVKNGKRVEIANVHPTRNLVTETPNEHQTSYEFWETIIASAVLHGVGYAIIERDEREYAKSILWVHNTDVELKEIKGERIYVVKDYGVVRPENMLTICNLFRMSPIRLHRENLGLAKSAQDFGSEYFGQSGQMTGVLTSDQPLKKEQMDMIQGSWNNGAANAGTKLMPFGFKYQRISIAPDEAQFIETRQFQAQEICRIFSVPAALVQLPGQTTYNNVEQQNLMFARHTIQPWAKRIQQEIDKKLIPSFDRPAVYSRFNLNDLYRGDMDARAGFFTQMLQSGVMSINEVRAEEDKNPIDGGDVHLVQVNQIALDKIQDYSDNISNNNNGREEPTEETGE
jgi:HK97 family phage portal protein